MPRLRLYSFLKKLGTRALYCDTGHVIYVAITVEPPPIEGGDRLGDMTNELRPGEYIDEFVSVGPKVVKHDGSTKSVCKVRGITLSYTTSQIVNFETIRDMVLIGDRNDVVVYAEKKIKNKRERGGPFLVSQAEENAATSRFPNVGE